MRDQVFIAASPEDGVWAAKLQQHLRVRRELKVFVAGTDRVWRTAEALQQARVAVIFISKDFLASDLLGKQVLEPAVEATQRGEVVLLWALVAQCTYEQWPLLRDLQPAHDVQQPLMRLANAEVDEVMTQLCRRVHEIMDLVPVPPAPAAPAPLAVSGPRSARRLPPQELHVLLLTLARIFPWPAEDPGLGPEVRMRARREWPAEAAWKDLLRQMVNEDLDLQPVLAEALARAPADEDLLRLIRPGG